MLVCQVDDLIFCDPMTFKNLENAYFIGHKDKYLVTVEKGEQEYISTIYSIVKHEFVLIATFNINFIKTGSRFVEVNNSKNEFFVHHKPNCIVRFKSEGKQTIEINKIKQTTQIHGFHVTDKVVITVSNNVTIEDKNFSSATVYDLNGNILLNRDFKNVQEAKIIHNADGILIRLYINGISTSIC